ncbi:Hypothetical predicted protein [Mytilus galloprovincialis]|uniref:Uncharacterized protein n=1 Tax=Mytilus galloprovincialis TaxID=29158 RepID=A0A8B6D973_MYTGA|nr:Hypothetical predicted protein [Mytilus galloprovincialis]
MSSTEDSDSGLSQSSQVAADIMSILASGDEASFSGFSAVADESVHFSPPKKRQLKSVVVPPESVKKLKKTSTSKQNNERGPGKGPGKNKKGKAPVKRGNIAKPSDKDKEREDEFRRIYSKLELLLDRQNSNADRYELASAPEHPVAPEEDEGEGEVDFSQYDIFGNNADDEFESEVNSEEEFAYAIPKIFEDDDKFGDETHKSIAALVNAVTNRKSVITEIAKDYKVPSNSKSLAPPKVNPEIWHLLNRQARSDDLSFQTIQRILGFGIVPVIRTAEALTKPDAVKMVAKMRVNINNALSMLCAAFFEISYVRRMTLKNNMDQKYHQLCTRHLDVTEYLFGDDVSKKVKDINDAQKMKGVVNTATSKKLETRGLQLWLPPRYKQGQRKIPKQTIMAKEA